MPRRDDDGWTFVGRTTARPRPKDLMKIVQAAPSTVPLTTNGEVIYFDVPHQWAMRREADRVIVRIGIYDLNTHW